MKIIGKPTGDLPIKRFHLDGVTMQYTCPKCGKSDEEEWAGDSVSYPPIGEPFRYYLGCHACGHDWHEMVVIDINLRCQSDKEEED